MIKELSEIQRRFKAPKDQYNQFGGFTFRNAERMLAILKPILSELNCTLTINDNAVAVGNKNYIMSTVTITNSDGESIATSALAWEDEQRGGMANPQMTGSASSYSRKYALCGLLAVDGGEIDPDSEQYPSNKRQKHEQEQKHGFQRTGDCHNTLDEVSQFINNKWENADEEQRHLLNAFFTDCKERSKWLSDYGVKQCWYYFNKDYNEGMFSLAEREDANGEMVWYANRTKSTHKFR